MLMLLLRRDMDRGGDDMELLLRFRGGKKIKCSPREVVQFRWQTWTA